MTDTSDELTETDLLAARDAGVDFVFDRLAKALKLERWEQKDGTEDWEGDVVATLYGILHGARAIDPETNEAAADLIARLSADKARMDEPASQPLEWADPDKDCPFCKGNPYWGKTLSSWTRCECVRRKSPEVIAHFEDRDRVAGLIDTQRATAKILREGKPVEHPSWCDHMEAVADELERLALQNASTTP